MVQKYPWGTESTALNDSQPTKLSEESSMYRGLGTCGIRKYSTECRRSIWSAVNRSSIPLL